MSLAMKRVSLVTGANRGIGREIARQLALEGLQVILACRDEMKGKQTMEELQVEGVKVDYLVADATDRQSVREAIQAVDEKYGQLDVLVNNAGIILDRGVSVLEVEEETITTTLNTNFLGPLRFTQEAVPLMRKHHYGRIVNLSSGLGAFEVMQGMLGLKGSSAAYRISKTTLNALTCLTALEVSDWGIKVNAVCPGRVQTDMGGADAPSTVTEGADTVVWLATLDEKGPTGGFFRNRQSIAW